MGSRAVRKILGYRDLAGASQAAHRAHWEGFTWSTGDVVVNSFGPWGCCQVWASTAAEGQRVIRHAGAIGGWNPDDPNVSRWAIGASGSSRYGRSATVGVKIRRGVPWISKRDGPSGAPRAD